MNHKKTLNLLGHLKKRNVKRFSIFIAIAFVFLIFSKLSNDYKQYIKIKIELTGLAEEIILKEDANNTIDVLVEAKGFALVPYIFKNSKTIVLDANKDVISQPNAFVFDVQKNNFLIEDQLGSSYKIRTLKPDVLVMPYSKRASKYVPIVLNANVEYAAGYDIKGDFTFNRDSIKIVGSEEKIKAVASIETEVLQLKNINSNINESVKLQHIEGVEVFPKTINAQADVKRFTEGKIEVPLTITDKPKNIQINYFPKTVTISYYVDLENYNLITPSDFEVECSFNGLNENQNYFVPKVTKSPEFIKRINMKQKRIDFIKL